MWRGKVKSCRKKGGRLEVGTWGRVKGGKGRS